MKLSQVFIYKSYLNVLSIKAKILGNYVTIWLHFVLKLNYVFINSFISIRLMCKDNNSRISFFQSIFDIIFRSNHFLFLASFLWNVFFNQYGMNKNTSFYSLIWLDSFFLSNQISYYWFCKYASFQRNIRNKMIMWWRQ